MFKEDLEKQLETPDNTDLGKKNIEEMEKLVEQMREDGEYIDSTEKKSKKIKKAKTDKSEKSEKTEKTKKSSKTK